MNTQKNQEGGKSQLFISAEEVKKGKTMAVVAHITIIGCLVAIFSNIDSKNKYSGFYIKQAFGIHLLFYALAYFVGMANSWFMTSGFFLCFFILWVYSFVGSLSNDIKVLPAFGVYFQKWFNKLSA
ncbi:MULTISPECIES: hypothetical protein [Myroides]|uniref:DUF4870 domain-containing protein n=1 Tax=Myroides albus TaxID=2562892 RepID=A0A6I3LHS3_9FLAO|nr:MULTISPECIES: hypothetical protein [Myroides]MTG97793.1 hypothetical protein [Myroides albus]MVX34875.1 hypothetical protein [Myroides sp. LoEW2-1]UVD79750.1 hypothetical protein NWE55_00195 [Myroides albus]